MEILSEAELRAIDEIMTQACLALPVSEILIRMMSEADRGMIKIRANNEELKSRQPLYDWSEAPEWAHYAACDRSGNAWWFENAPEVIEYGRYEPRGGKSRAMRGTFEYNWKDSLEKRPDNL